MLQQHTTCSFLAGLNHPRLSTQARFPGNQVLQRQLDDWVEEHEAAAVRKRKAAEAAAEDGWTVVKRSRVRFFLACCCPCTGLMLPDTCSGSTALRRINPG